MGTKQRPRPKRLAEKLLKIRRDLQLSQDELIDRMGLKEELVRSTISQFERGEREPSYIALLAYAKLAGVCCDYLIDDSLNLDNTSLGKTAHNNCGQINK